VAIRPRDRAAARQDRCSGGSRPAQSGQRSDWPWSSAFGGGRSLPGGHRLGAGRAFNTQRFHLPRCPAGASRSGGQKPSMLIRMQACLSSVRRSWCSRLGSRLPRSRAALSSEASTNGRTFVPNILPASVSTRTASAASPWLASIPSASQHMGRVRGSSPRHQSKVCRCSKSWCKACTSPSSRPGATTTMPSAG
jgi:hypothetical protein